MSVSERLKNAVTAKDIVAIRDCLWSRIALDPNFTRGFPESWKYCLSNGIAENKLYEPHDGRPMSGEVSNENFSALCGELSTNFSKERLDKIKEIGRELYPVREEKPVKQTTVVQNSTSRRYYRGPSSNHSAGSSGLLITGLAIGAIAGGVLGGIIFGKTLAVGIGAIAGATAGGATGATLSKK